jgi:C4-dicarboxylate-specific signal transduction histidine kinase
MRGTRCPQGATCCCVGFVCVLPDGLPGVELSVRDSGAGMDPESLRRACLPVFSTMAGVSGIRMGLAATSGFARQSGGALTLVSGRHGGLTAGLQLPQGREAG